MFKHSHVDQVYAYIFLKSTRFMDYENTLKRPDYFNKLTLTVSDTIFSFMEFFIYELPMTLIT